MPGLILAADGAIKIKDRVRDGDPTVGWRGDPEAIVYFNEDHDECEVHLKDASGRYYVAAAQSVHEAGWQYALLRRLRDGDWQLGAAGFDRHRVAAEKRTADDAKADDEFTEELAERMAWALRRDAGHLVGQSKEFY